MYLNELQNTGLFHVKINLEEAYRETKDEDLAKKYAGLYIDLRELSSAEMIDLNKAGAEEYVTKMLGNLEACIVDHNIEQSQGKKAASTDVAGLIRNSSTLSTYVVRTWGEALPFSRLTLKNSEKPHES